MSARTESIAKAPRDRARFQGVVETRAVCGWCDEAFTYGRHMGRTRTYCSSACAKAMNRAQAVANAHFIRRDTAVPKRRCPDRVRCWVCLGYPSAATRQLSIGGPR